MLLAITVAGCASIELPSHRGVPQRIGCGWTKQPPAKQGHVVQLVAPGLSLRLQKFTPGLSLGWHETTYFFPETGGTTNAPISVLALQTKVIGINLAPGRITIGFSRRLAVPLPAEDCNVVQIISYSETRPKDTVVVQKEFK